MRLAAGDYAFRNMRNVYGVMRGYAGKFAGLGTQEVGLLA